MRRNTVSGAFHLLAALAVCITSAPLEAQDSDFVARSGDEGRLGFEGIHLGMTGRQLAEALGDLGYSATRALQTFNKGPSHQPGSRDVMVRYTASLGGVGIPVDQRPAEFILLSLSIPQNEVERQRVFDKLVRQYGQPSTCAAQGSVARYRCTWTKSIDGGTESLVWQSSRTLNLQLSAESPQSPAQRAGSSTNLVQQPQERPSKATCDQAMQRYQQANCAKLRPDDPGIIARSYCPEVVRTLTACGIEPKGVLSGTPTGGEKFSSTSFEQLTAAEQQSIEQDVRSTKTWCEQNSWMSPHIDCACYGEAVRAKRLEAGPEQNWRTLMAGLKNIASDCLNDEKTIAAYHESICETDGVSQSTGKKVDCACVGRETAKKYVAEPNATVANVESLRWKVIFSPVCQ